VVRLSKSFDVVSVDSFDDHIKVVVEFESRDRKSFVFPLSDEWLSKDEGNEYLFVRNIREWVFNEMQRKDTIRNIDFSGLQGKRLECCAPGLSLERKRLRKFGPNARAIYEQNPDDPRIKCYLDEDCDFNPEMRKERKR
jgi:hypothetical protein